MIADTLVPMVPLGQFFGRMGCFAAGCCWGEPLDASNPLAVQFPAGSLIHSSMQRGGQIAQDYDGVVRNNAIWATDPDLIASGAQLQCSVSESQ